MEKNSTHPKSLNKITQIFGLYLLPGIYNFFFIMDEKRIVYEHYERTELMNGEIMNYIEMKEKNNQKEILKKIYIFHETKPVFIQGSWDNFSAKHKMLSYNQEINSFYEKEKEFIGLESLKQKNYKQVEKFQYYLAQKDFDSFHGTHYDWWAFPIGERSSKGFKYTIDPVEAEFLKKDEEYMKFYLLGVKLLAFSWGWDILNADFIENPIKNQCWSHWPIRLFKAVVSLEIMRKCECGNDWNEKIDIYFRSLKKYAEILIKKHGKFHYGSVKFETVFPENLNDKN